MLVVCNLEAFLVMPGGIQTVVGCVDHGCEGGWLRESCGRDGAVESRVQVGPLSNLLR
jgi:hypothetical protein